MANAEDVGYQRLTCLSLHHNHLHHHPCHSRPLWYLCVPVHIIIYWCLSYFRSLCSVCSFKIFSRILCQKYFNFCCCCNCDDRISKENDLKFHIKHVNWFPINNDIVSWLISICKFKMHFLKILQAQCQQKCHSQYWASNASRLWKLK